VVSTFANPVVFASLDHRLPASNPPGWNDMMHVGGLIYASAHLSWREFRWRSLL
jgi:hypothetical protein